MANACFPMVRGRRFRMTRLDGCGNPVLGPDSTYVSDGVISVALTANNDEGEEINVTNSNGDICVLDEPCPRLLNYSVEIEFCRVNVGLFSMLTGQRAIESEGDVIGFAINSEVEVCDTGYALEAWTGIPTDACEPGQGQQYGYILLPFLRPGTLGDFTIENAAITFTLTGSVTQKGTNWGVGPYDVINVGGVPSPLPEALVVGDHVVPLKTTLPPPPADCEPQELGTPATGAEEVAGAEGTWTPANSYAPEDFAELSGSAVVADPATAWSAGSFVTLRDGSHAYWDGSAWVAGEAP